MTPETFRKWAIFDASIGTLCIIFGLVLLIANLPEIAFTEVMFGFVLFGFSAVCQATYIITKEQKDRIASLEQRLTQIDQRSENRFKSMNQIETQS